MCVWRILLLLALIACCGAQYQRAIDYTGETVQTPPADPYQSSSFIGYSLWMIPTGDSFEMYSNIIRNTAAELGTFEYIPHITLVGAILSDVNDVITKTKELASNLAPFQFEFTTVSHREAFFQCVYAMFERTDEVVAANLLAREFFSETKANPPYMPHLSLIYGSFSPEQKETVIVPNLKRQIEDKAPATTTIHVDSIQIWCTKGNVSDWYLFESVPLRGSNGI
jgi:hypothetical protein